MIARKKRSDFTMRRSYYLTLLLGFLLARDAYSYTTEEKNRVVKKWERAAETFDSIVWPQTRFFLEALDQLTSDASFNLTTACRGALQHVRVGLAARKHWAHKCKPCLISQSPFSSRGLFFVFDWAFIIANCLFSFSSMINCFFVIA